MARQPGTFGDDYRFPTATIRSIPCIPRNPHSPNSPATPKPPIMP